MSAPSSWIDPFTAAPGTSSCMRLRVRRNVLLPQPDGPMNAVTMCGSIVRVTSRNARKDPYQASSPSMVMRPFDAVPGPGLAVGVEAVTGRALTDTEMGTRALGG